MKLVNAFTLSVLASACMTTAFAAKPINLKHQSISILQSYFGTSLASSATGLKEVRRSIDFNKTTHIHLQQTYAGYPVWGGDSVVHVPKGGNTALASLAANPNATMNGMLFQGVEKDLGVAPAASEAEQALQMAIEQYQATDNQQRTISDSKAELMVFVDKEGKAHWAYLISFLAEPAEGLPAKPTIIMDAKKFNIYQQWDNIQTLDDVSGGGFGGNKNMGKLTYDGLANNYPALSMQRDASNKICYVKNKDVVVQDARKWRATTMSFTCPAVSTEHNFIYWDASFDAANGAYSPSNDALFIGKVVQDLYLNWYSVPVLVTSQGKPMVLTMRVHKNMENAYWDGKTMTFGDGGKTFYPLVSLGIGAHEISHGFTEQHSNLVYDKQSGGLNESFSDMASKAAEFYANGRIDTWEVGAEVMKEEGTALRYMDEPTKDCNGGAPGNNCSIDNVKDYNDQLDVHYTSGVFNKAFYLLAYRKGWNNTQKAFDVMVKANQDYWTSKTTFADAACGVLQAAKDYRYDTKVVMSAFATVGLTDLDKC